MKPLSHVHFTLAVFAFMLPASGDVIYSNLKNIAIPKNHDGVYLNLFTGNTSGTHFTGWHINPTFGGIHIYNTAAFQPLRESSSAKGMLSHFATGELISSSSQFFATGFGVSGDHLGSGGTFTAGTAGYLGFSVVDGSDTHYGWMRVVLTGTGTPLIHDWAYNTGGGSIAAGNVIQAGSTYTLDSATQSFTLGSAFTGSNEVIVQGGNTVYLSSSHSYTGVTTIHSGTLAISTGGSIEGTSRIHVGAGATLDVSAAAGNWTLGANQTLSGTGTILGDVTIAGTHAPGNSPGLQPIDGDAIYTSTSIFDWDLSTNADTARGATRGTDYDAVNITGDLTFQSGAIFRVIQNLGLDFSDSFWQSHRQWTDIFQVNGDTAGWAMNTPVGVFNMNDQPVDVSNYGSFTVSGTTLRWAAVPEPSNALIGMLLAACLLRRRRPAR